MTELEYGLEGVRLCLSAAALAGAGAALNSSIQACWRQELYEIRNELWDGMRREGQLDHPTYRELRDGINGLIRLAPAIGLLHAAANLAVVWRATRGRMDSEIPAHELSPLTAAAALAVERASHRVSRALAHRVFFDTFPGCLLGWPSWALWAIVRRVRPAASGLRRRFGTAVRGWVAEMAEHIEHQAAASERRRKETMVT